MRFKTVMLQFLKVFDDWSFLFHFFILDLPKLHTISFSGSNVLAGDANNYEKNVRYFQYNNKLIMKSKSNCGLKHLCVDLPSLTYVECEGKYQYTHANMGCVILESMNY